jgi:membrane-associated phospholipid phosphatase
VIHLINGDAGDFKTVNEFARDTHWLHGIATAYANDGVVLFGVLLLLGWWVARGKDAATMARALLAGVSVLVAVALNQPIVHAVDETRPYNALPNVLVLVHRSVDASFPSDHATMAGAVAAGLLLVSWRLGAVALVAALLMAATRVYVGAHYPVDVLAGLALGASVALLLGLSLTGPVSKLVTWAGQNRLRPLVTRA